MLRNLQAEMVRHGVSPKDIARLINKDEKTVRRKIREKSDFTFPEAIKIKDAFFKDCSLQYLFTGEQAATKDAV